MAKSFSFIGSVKIAAFLGLTISAHLAASQTEGTPLLRLQHSTAALAIDSAPRTRGGFPELLPETRAMYGAILTRCLACSSTATGDMSMRNGMSRHWVNQESSWLKAHSAQRNSRK